MSLQRLLIVAFVVVIGVNPRIASDIDLTGSRPNIVLIITDDQGYGDLACHGNPLLQTPNLDRLHRESVRLTDFHVSPTCAPTRAALMTGRHEFKSGVTHTILERERLNLNATTIAQVLQSAGYATGIFGKWHLGDEPAYQPGRRGFDEDFIHGGGGIGQTYPGSCGDAPGNQYFNPAILHNGKFERTEGYCTDVFFDRANRWIADQSQTGAPFFAYICTNAPHEPLVSPGPKYEQLYEGRSISGRTLDQGSIAYYAMITNIDENIGRLLAQLANSGVDRDTIVIFLTDNGGTHTQLFNAGMRGRKVTPYQGGTRVPSFWRWPGTLAAGIDANQLTAHVDVFPTIAALAGAQISNSPPLDGRNLLPILADPQAEWPDRYLFTHVGRWEPGQADSSKFNRCAVRNARFRFVNNAELYDIHSDPGETKNVIAEHPEVVADMRKAYDDWWKEVRGDMINEDAIGPAVNPFKALYWQQFGGPPADAAD
jgi:arylsulfatase A-like enzyme